METIVYRVRHKPTGLFYQPCKGRWSWEKSNLSLRGKIYITKQYPTPSILSNTRCNVSETLVKKFKLSVTQPRDNRENVLATREEDWEVVKYLLKEIVR